MSLLICSLIKHYIASKGEMVLKINGQEYGSCRGLV
jgi:hypothetical protein